MLKLHPRFFVVRKAETELDECVSKIAREHDLTSIELLQILATRSQNELKYMLRAERHPGDPGKKADEE